MNSNFNLTMYRQHFDEVRRTYDRLAPYFDYFYPPIDFDRSSTLKQMLDFLTKTGVESILDCACGTGREIVALERGGQFKSLYASDLSSRMLRVARKRASDSCIRLVHSDWYDLPKKLKCKFDAIICLGNSLSHLPAWGYAAVFEKFYNLLNTSGIFIFSERDWDVELGKSGNRMPLTVYYQNGNSCKSRISLLNSVRNGNKEILAYITYHLYNEGSRDQLLHLLKYGPKAVCQKTFRFRVFFTPPVVVSNIVKKLGFSRFVTLPIKADIDKYAAEKFYGAIK